MAKRDTLNENIDTLTFLRNTGYFDDVWNLEAEVEGSSTARSLQPMTSYPSCQATRRPAVQTSPGACFAAVVA